jgi:putative protease
MQRPEVLAPAGDRASLEAAVAAGADAVYFGLRSADGSHGFNARARAHNFDVAALDETMAFLRRHGVRGYVTLNTLLFDAELDGALAAARACATAGVDAVIVQDLGLARLVGENAPSLALHASTQMTCTDAPSVRLAASLGARRVILARELSIDEIAAIRAELAADPVELEVFVHGALCVAYSGQCLTSEAIGGRSANRGACAQACRLPYELIVDGVVRDLGERAYLLSPEDLEASVLVPELAAAGIVSLKIEGRLKGPEYVGAATALYRRAVDEIADSGLRRAALQSFSRGSGPGFLRGVDHQRLVEARGCDHRGLLVGEVVEVRGDELRIQLDNSDDSVGEIEAGDGLLVEGAWAGDGELGGRVWRVTSDGKLRTVWLGPDRRPHAGLVGRRVFRTNAPRPPAPPTVERRRPLALTLRGTLGAPPTLSGSSDGVSAQITLDAPLEAARSVPLDESVLRDKLGALGDTPYALSTLTVELPPNVMLPLSALKRARRALIAALDAAPRPALAPRVVAPLGPMPPTPPPSGLFVLCRSLAQAEAALDAGADGVYLDFLELTGTGTAFRALRPRAATLGVAPPRIQKPGEEKIPRYLASLAPDLTLVRSLGALTDGGTGMRIGDFSLNVTNRRTAAEVLGRGLAAFTPSLDLDSAQLVALLDGTLAPFAEVVVHQPMPLFHMEHCVFAHLLSDGRDHKTCGRPCERHKIALRDRAGLDHPVEADVSCRNTVFHAAAQSAAELVPRLAEHGVRRFRIELVQESAADTARTVAQYRALVDGRARPADVWRALRADNTYGVVRGSLRVL